MRGGRCEGRGVKRRENAVDEDDYGEDERENDDNVDKEDGDDEGKMMMVGMKR